MSSLEGAIPNKPWSNEQAKNDGLSHEQGTSKQSGCERKSKKGAQRSDKFKGCIPKLEEVVYNSALPNSSQDLFTWTTKAIARYVASELPDANEFWLSIVSMHLTMLSEPAKPTNSKLSSTKRYKFELRQYLTKTKHCEKTMEQVFAIIFGQCSCTICNCMEAAQSWKSINN